MLPVVFYPDEIYRRLAEPLRPLSRLPGFLEFARRGLWRIASSWRFCRLYRS